MIRTYFPIRIPSSVIKIAQNKKQFKYKLNSYLFANFFSWLLLFNAFIYRIEMPYFFTVSTGNNEIQV